MARTPNARARVRAWCYLLVAALGACGGSGATAPADPDAGGPDADVRGSTGPGAEATAACLEACDHQIGAGCPGTTEIFRPFCENGCDATTEQTHADCFDELLALQRCRAALTWECDGFGGSQPTSTCATESGACLQCMGGMICDGLASFLRP